VLQLGKLFARKQLYA